MPTYADIAGTIGAVTGIASLGWQITSRRLNQPQVTVSGDAGVDMGSTSEPQRWLFDVRVVNNGREPVTLTMVAWEVVEPARSARHTFPAVAWWSPEQRFRLDGRDHHAWQIAVPVDSSKLDGLQGRPLARFVSAARLLPTAVHEETAYGPWEPLRL